MELHILSNADTVAREAAGIISSISNKRVLEGRRFSLAVSGGSTPWKMLQWLAHESLAWDRIDLFQTDERIAPAGAAERNLTHLEHSLLSRVPLAPENVHAMPVERQDLDAAAGDYIKLLISTLGDPPVLDLVHLGLGADGHTASLLPGEEALDTQALAAVTGEYQGHRRMTLTYPVINRAQNILWLITGASKREMLKRLCGGDSTIPAGRISQENAIVLADRDAAAELDIT